MFFSSNLIKQITDATEKGWNENANLGILSIVELEGKPIEDAFYPAGGSFKMTNEMKGCIINISLNACKSFGFNSENQSFEYDVSSNGKPFYGRIPLWTVLGVFDIDTNKSYFELNVLNPSESSKVSENLETNKNTTFQTELNKPTLIFVNPDKTIKVNKSTANLKLVK